MSNSTLSADALELNEGTTAFMFISTCMVQFMTPGLALFYGGLVGNNSVISVMFQSYMALATVFLLWILCGFSLGFGEPLITVGGYGLLGNPSTYFMLQGVSVYEPLQRAGSVVASGFPGILFMAYQGMFAVITPALIVGSFIDRLRFGPSVVFTALWLLTVYCPLAFWNWGGGWMAQVGAWDFAGGMVVHESSGFSALAAVYLLGRRRYEKDQVGSAFFRKPHNIPFVLTGTAMLWFGWFGFNGGSALSSGGLAGLAMVNSQIAASAGMAAWVAQDFFLEGQPKLVGACAGTICGLVAITPCAGFIQSNLAVLAGAMASLVSYNAVKWVERLELDDAIDGIGVHGVSGLLGTILVGALADPQECLDGDTAPKWCANPGTVARSMEQVGIQAACGLFTCLYSFGMTYIILALMMFGGAVVKLTTAQAQDAARDISQYGEFAYAPQSLDLKAIVGSGSNGDGDESGMSDSDVASDQYNVSKV